MGEENKWTATKLTKAVAVICDRSAEGDIQMSTLINSSGHSRKVLQVVTTCFSGSRKNVWKRWIDLTLYLVSCAIAGTGLLLGYRLPHGHGAGSIVTFLGHGRHDWGSVHTWLAYVAIVLVVLHLVLNREWLVKIAASGRLPRLAAGIFAGLLIGSAFLVLPVEQRDRSTEATIERPQARWEEPGVIRSDH
jgi:hypothetical protein